MISIHRSGKDIITGPPNEILSQVQHMHGDLYSKKQERSNAYRRYRVAFIT